jgi:hypothetical protein
VLGQFGGAPETELVLDVLEVGSIVLTLRVRVPAI